LKGDTDNNKKNPEISKVPFRRLKLVADALASALSRLMKRELSGESIFVP